MAAMVKKTGLQRVKPVCQGIRFGVLNVESPCGRKTEVCDVCYMQEVRSKNQEASFLGTSG